MSQPPYPPPGGSEAGEDGSSAAQHDPGGQPNPGAQPYPGAQTYPGAGDPPPGGDGGYEGPPRYGQTPYGQPPYGESPYGQPSYGQAPYGQAPYGRPPYGAAPYGQAQPGVPAAPPWGRGSTSGAGKSSKVAVVGAVVGALAIAGLAVALFLGLRSGDGGEAGSGSDSSIPAATSEPEGLGDDPELDDYAEECHGGDMAACDELFRKSPEYSAYELYGGTCAGRQSNSDARDVYCVEAFPPAS